MNRLTYKNGMVELSAENQKWMFEQLDKCENCPCLNVNGCINCQHYKKDCIPGKDCSTASIKVPTSLKLCSTDDCITTYIMAEMYIKSHEEGGNNA